MLFVRAVSVYAVQQSVEMLSSAGQLRPRTERTDPSSQMRQEAIILLEPVLKQFHVIPGHVLRQAISLHGDTRRSTHRLSQQCTGSHHARGTHCRVGHGNIAPGEHQIRDMFAVKTAERNSIGRGRWMIGGRRFLRAEAGGMMIVHRPTPVGNFIRKISARANVVLGHGISAHIAAAFALARQDTHPVQTPVFILLRLFRIVFQIIPHAIRQSEQLITDFLGIADGIPHAAQLQIPEVFHRIGQVRQAMIELASVDLFCPEGRNECMRRIGFLRLNHAGQSHGMAVRLLRWNGFAKFTACLTTFAVGRAG